MAGTKAGGLKAAAKNLSKDPDFYRKIGGKGGRNGKTGGYGAYIQCNCNIIKYPHHKAQCSGVKGGTISRRNYKKKEEVVYEPSPQELSVAHSAGAA